jgi:hypothetical protein
VKNFAKNHLILKSALALALATPLLASAESDITIGGNSAAQARLNFQVIIPRVLFLAVGTGSTGFADNSQVDVLTFDYTAAAAAATLGNNTPSSAQNVNVRVLGNNGQIAITATGTGTGLVGAAATDVIPWSEITATSSDATNFNVPAVGGSAANPVLDGTKVTNRTATWSYAYANTTTPAAGTYTGTVTYTATMP